jgi:DNA-binding HxlR family transcriptional regulator
VLRTLETKRIIKRTVHPTIPPSVEYTVTELGWSLVPPLASLCQWADDHLDDLR